MRESSAHPYVVVPVRGIDTGKSRLAAVLDAPSRAAFNAWLLNHTLRTVAEWLGSLERCVVVSACERVRDAASAAGAAVLIEDAGAGLNGAAAMGVRHATRRGASKALVLACDLPQVTAQSLEAFARDAGRGDVAIAADESGTGTNALIVSTSSAFELTFGNDSFTRHSEAAAALGLRLVVHRSPALAFDVDTPDHYARWQAISAENVA